MSGNLGANLINQLQNTPMASPDYWTHQMANMNALQDYNAKQAWGQALQQATDPTTGTVDYGKAQALAAGNPMARAGMATNLQNTSNIRSQQIAQVSSTYDLAGRASASALNDPSDANMANIRASLVTAGAPASMVSEVDRIAALPVAQRGAEAYKHLNAVLDGQGMLARGNLPAMSLQNTGGQVVTAGAASPSPYGPGGVVGGTGGIAITPTPGEALQGGYHYPATQADVDAGRAQTVGQDVYIPGAEVYRRAGLPVPPGLQGGGGGGGGGVVNADGTRASPASPPRLLNVPGQPNAAPPPATTTPAPTGGPPAAPAVGGNVGIGAALARPQGAPAAAPAPPVPPTAVPPPPAPTPSGPAPIWNPNNPVGTSAVTPSTANPAIAAAQAQARATRQPVPVPGVPGLVANPDGSVGPPGGSGFPRPALPPNAPQASLQGGVPVASVNALAPNLGAPSAPSPLVPGDVNAIMAGVNARRGAPPTQGTQTAFNTVAAGPGTEEAQGYKTSADTLAAYDLERANFQQTQFPYVQALKNYGEGTKTGPTTDFWNQVAGSIRTPLAKIGVNVGPLADTTERVDALGKWLASIQSGSPLAGKSDAELAQVLKGSASTHINEVAGEDMVKAGLGLQRMKVAAAAEWHNNPAMQQQYGTFLNFLGHYNQTTDPRAFMVDTLNDAQKQRLLTQLKNGSEADAQRFEASKALAKRNGMLSGAGSQAMP